MNYGRVNSGSERLDAKLQQKTFTPDRFPFDKHATTYGIDGFSEVIINAPENFSAENIKQGVNIAGVTGTFEGSASTLGTADIKPTAFPTTKNASDDGVDGYSTVTVQAPDNLTAENIKSGVSIAGVTGTYEGGGSGQLDDRTKFWLRAIQNNGMRYDAKGNFIPFVMLKEYWPDKLQGYEIIGGSVPSALQMSNFCCSNFRLNSVELPEGKGTDGYTIIPSSAFFMAGPYEYGAGDYFRYMVVTGGETETYQFGSDCFKSARLSDIPDVNYYQNTISGSLFGSATFYTCNVPEGITTIEANSLTSIRIVSDNTIRLPSTLTTINGYVSISGGYSDHINIVLKSTTPPTLENSSCIQYVDSITVPAGTLEAYRTATNWSALADIMVEATTEAGTTEGGA